MKASLKNLETDLEQLKILSSKVADLQIRDLREMNARAAEILADDSQDEAIGMLKAFGENNKISLPVVHYFLSILAYAQGQSDDLNFGLFLQYLANNGKTKLIHAVCEMFLEKFESILALTTLISYYEKNGENEKVIALLKRFIPRNRKDVAIPKKIARLLEKTNITEATTYYEIALIRSFEISDFGEAADCWKRLILLTPKDVDFHLSWLKRLVSHVLPEQKHSMFSMLIKNQEHSMAGRKAIVKIIKACLRSDVIPFSQLFLLLKAYREIYEEHVYLNDFLSLSGLLKMVKNPKKSQTAQVILSQIHVFEKYICFEKGKFVRHQSFGLGMIQEFMRKEKTALPSVATEAKLVVDFQEKKNHHMSLSIAFNSLELCYEKHLLALKAFHPEKLAELLAGDESDFLRHTLLTIGHLATQKEIHDLLVPKIADEESWSKLWKSMKTLFNLANEFEYDGKTYGLVEKGFDLHTRTIDSLKKTTKSEEKIRIIESYFIQISTLDPQVLRHMQKDIEALMQEQSKYAMLLLVFKQHISIIQGKPDSELILKTFKQLYSVENLADAYQFCNFQQFRHMLLLNMEACFEKKDFAKEIEALFLTKAPVNIEYVFHFLDKRNHQGIMMNIFLRVAENYLENIEGFFVAGRHLLLANVLKKNELRGELFFKLVKLLAELNRLISISKDISDSKRLFYSINSLLFDERFLIDFLNSSNPATMKYKEAIFQELEKQAFLNEDFKVEIRALHEKHRRD